MEPMKNSAHCSQPGEDNGGAATAAPPASNEAAAGADAGAVCSVCKRTFASRKAMYGHMRSHPESERRRRTLRATPAAEKPCNQSHGSSSIASPRGGSWSKIAKRGSKGMVASSNNPVHSPDSENPAATMDGHHKVLEINSASGQPEVIKRATLLLDTAEGGKGEAASKGETNSEVSASAIVAGSSDDTASDPHCGHKADGDGLGGRACDHRSCNEWCFSSSQRKKRGEDSEAETGSRSGNACTASGRSSSSSRASGGHMASHGKLTGKDSTMGSGSDDGVGRAAAAGISKSTQRLRPEAIPVEHRCNVCSKTYPTGQALGGHKRLHYKGLKKPPPPPPPPVGGAAAPSSRGLQSSSRRLRDFDLNELPRQEEDGERRVSENSGLNL